MEEEIISQIVLNCLNNLILFNKRLAYEIAGKNNQG